MNTKADQHIAYHKTFATGALRLTMLYRGLAMEIRCPGMRMTARAPKCSTILRKEFGLSGQPPKLLAQFGALLAAHGIVVAPQEEGKPVIRITEV